MDKSLYSMAKIEDAGEICRKIIEDATAQASSILTSAEKEKSKILEEANHESENKKKEALKKNDIEIEKMKQKIFSTLNLEKKKLFLEEKSRFIEAVLEKAREIATEFRQNPDYKTFLEKAISEGVDVIGEKGVDVLYSGLDEKIIRGDFIKNVNGIALEFKKCDFKDIGVIVQSKDSRLIYDNTFSARFKRLHDDIYMDLLKGAF
nr:hypothetical protein [Candidatus Omnitrophota bacterium]